MVSGGLELEELLEEFDAVFWSLANQGPSQEELDSARMQWQAQKIASLEGLESTGLMLARCMAVHENPDCMAPEMSAIEQVRPQQIQAAIRSHLSRDRVILARVPENQRHLGLDATTEAK
jgi:predicted Zn-dependent peptidase